MDSRTKELRRAAAVMNQPAPISLTDLSPEARAALDAGLESARRGEIADFGSFAQYADTSPREPQRRYFDCGHARPRGVRLEGAYHECRGCDRARRKRVRHWLLYGVAWAVLLLTTCTGRAANDGPCAPYSPVDGRTCAPPARLGHIGQAPVCYCPGPKVARR